MRRVIAGLAMLMLAAPLEGQEPAEAVGAEHRVSRGETLWELAQRYLNDPYQWRVIYDANSGLLSDPDLILPGQVLMIPAAVAAAPTARISIRPGVQEPDPLGNPVADRAQPSQQQQAAQPTRAGLAFDRAGPRQATQQDPNRTVFYRQAPPTRTADLPTVLSEPEIERFPVRPGEFSSAAWVAVPSDLEVVGTFLRSVRTDPDAWGEAGSSHPNDRLFIAYGDGPRPEPGTRLVLVDVGDRVSTGAGHRIIDPRGIARVMALKADAIEARLEAQYGTVMPGQLALPEVPMPEQSAEAAEPVPDGYDLEGRIVAFAKDRPLHNREDLAFVDLGRADGVRLGDVFFAYIPSRESEAEGTDDRMVPPERVAELRVIRVTENAATVKVDGLSLPRLRDDLPVRRVRRMP